jgi:hypothetical protein
VSAPPATAGAPAITRRLFLLGIIGPLTGVSIGVDGGDIFQIVAAETLELDPRAVGGALLFGALSIPVQIWAARIPLARARHNIRIYLVLMGAMALASSLLVAAAPPGSWIAGLVLVIAVLAEIAVSVLFATSWQPLISYTLSVDQRQFVNGRGRASAGVALLGGAVLVGHLDQAGRALFLAGLAVVSVVVAWSLRVLPPPPPPGGRPVDAGGTAATHGRDGGSLTNVFISLPAMAFASWPLLVSYAAVVLGPGGNLGLLAGAMALGGVVASALWRDPGPHLVPLIRLAALVVAVCSAAIVALGSVWPDAVAAALLVTVAVGTAARTTMRTAVMELAHRRIDTSNSVRVMTMIDVVGSTAFQVGAFLAGFLIAASADAGGPIDPYEIWLLVTAAGLLVAAARFRASPSGSSPASSSASWSASSSASRPGSSGARRRSPRPRAR